MYRRLITPRGLITQFALSVELEIIQNIGWIAAGKYLDFDLFKTLGLINTNSEHAKVNFSGDILLNVSQSVCLIFNFSTLRIRIQI